MDAGIFVFGVEFCSSGGLWVDLFAVGTSLNILLRVVLVLQRFLLGLKFRCYLDMFQPKTSPLSHSLVCSKKHLFIVGLGPICDKEL